jgi:hypothetical protein
MLVEEHGNSWDMVPDGSFWALQDSSLATDGL